MGFRGLEVKGAGSWALGLLSLRLWIFPRVVALQPMAAKALMPVPMSAAKGLLAVLAFLGSHLLRFARSHCCLINILVVERSHHHHHHHRHHHHHFIIIITSSSSTTTSTSTSTSASSSTMRREMATSS